MKKQFLRKALASLFAFALLFALSEVEMKGDDFDFANSGTGTYTAAETGRIIMKASASGAAQFTDGAAATGTPSLGWDINNRIQGIVEWTSGTGISQDVQDRFYTHMDVTDAGTKAIPDLVYVGGAYTIGASCGDRTYTGVFYYDGDGSLASTVQIITGESDNVGGSATNNYNDVDLSLSAVLVFPGGTPLAEVTKINHDPVICFGKLTSDEVSDLTVANDFWVGTGISAIFGDITIDLASNTNTVPPTAIALRTFTDAQFDFGNGTTPNTLLVKADGSLNLHAVGTESEVAAPGVLTINENSVLEVEDADGILNVGYVDGSNDVLGQLNIGGLYTNGVASAVDRTNQFFSDVSYVRYIGTSTSLVGTADGTTDADNKYANLQAWGGLGLDKVADGSVYMRGILTVDGKTQVHMDATSIDGDYFLDQDVTTLPAATVNAVYAAFDNTGCVQGKMRLTGTIPTGEELTMNNYQTRTTFNASPTVYFQLDILPGLLSDHIPNFQADQSDLTGIDVWKVTRKYDLNRHVRLGWSGAPAEVPELTQLRIGYVDDDKDGAYLGLPGQDELMRFVEGYDVAELKQKIIMLGDAAAGTSNDPIVSGTGSGVNGFVDLSDSVGAGSVISLVPSTDNGGVSPDERQQISDASDIILTSAPVLYITVADGRWTNPSTWDQFKVPEGIHDTYVRHLVYTGIDQTAFGGLWLDDEIDGTGVDELGAIARSITIIDPSATTSLNPDGVGGDFTHPCLVIGFDDTNFADGRITRADNSGSTAIAFPNVEATGIHNLNATANDPSIGFSLAYTYDPADDDVHGIYVMESLNADKTLEVPFIGSGRINNQGTIVNAGGIIEVGK